MNPAPDGTIAWRELLAGATRSLEQVAGAGAPREARFLVAEASGVEPDGLAALLDESATTGGVARLDAMVQRRRAGEPLQYVLGSWGFRHLDVMVDPRVLIPRPETEQVVEEALLELDRLGGRRTRTRVLDLGTGSGAIALAIATERPRTEVWASDVDPGAVAVARANLVGIGRAAARVRIVEGDWFEPLPPELAGSFDLIVANPPYVPDGAELPDEVVRHEPPRALFGGQDGTDELGRIVRGAGEWLRPGGVLVCELSPEQGGALRGLAQRHFGRVRLAEDLTGRVRCIVAADPQHTPPVDASTTG